MPAQAAQDFVVNGLRIGSRIEVVDTIRYMYKNDPSKNYDLKTGQRGIVVDIDEEGDMFVDLDNVGGKWLLNRDTGKIMAIEESHAASEVTLTFDPGKGGSQLGVTVLENGVVTGIRDGPAREKGVKLGWQGRYIDGKVFTPSRLHRRLAGNRPFELVFLKAPSVIVTNLRKGSNSFPPGYYFYFDEDEWSAMVGSKSWNGSTFSVSQIRDETWIWSGFVSVWKSDIGGHGRQTVTPNHEQWKEGDVICIQEHTKPRPRVLKGKRLVMQGGHDESSEEEEEMRRRLAKQEVKEPRSNSKASGEAQAKKDSLPGSTSAQDDSKAASGSFDGMAGQRCSLRPELQNATQDAAAKLPASPSAQQSSADKPSLPMARPVRGEQGKDFDMEYGIEAKMVDEAPQESVPRGLGNCCECSAGAAWRTRGLPVDVRACMEPINTPASSVRRNFDMKSLAMNQFASTRAASNIM